MLTVRVQVQLDTAHKKSLNLRQKHSAVANCVPDSCRLDGVNCGDTGDSGVTGGVTGGTTVPCADAATGRGIAVAGRTGAGVPADDTYFLRPNGLTNPIGLGGPIRPPISLRASPP